LVEDVQEDLLAEQAEVAEASPRTPRIMGPPDSIRYEPASLIEEITGTIRRRETVSDLLTRHGFSHELVHAVNQSARPIFDFRHVRAGQPYALAKVGTTFCHFRYEIDPERYLLIVSRGKSLHSEVREYPFEVQVDSLVGTIESSLFKTILDLGEGPDLALEMSEIFAWDIDFFLDIRKGDHFKIFYQRKCLGESTVCYGRILAADFVVQGESHQAIYFCDETGYDDYYNFEGGSLRKALLKAPLRYSRISSSYSHRRFHPVHKHYAPHLGIDYAAPAGTPVRATGDGTVVLAARKGANGNLVQIRHNEAYSTYYLHLSKFGKGIKKGKQVKQGDVIGYVGATGVATGPHLDYRIKKHGKFIDPRKVDLPAADPVADVYRSEFESLRDEWAARLARLGADSGGEIALGSPSDPPVSHSPER
jgi:murein DD-endopeptidase MepM/ murein hydrolase activator NlpD